jgi:O-Antigen ligase
MIIQFKRGSLPNWNGNLSLWLVLFLSVGYPIQASIPILLHVSSTPINASFRAVYALSALILIISALPKKKIISRGSTWLLLFWLFYIVRFVVDISIRGIKFGEKDTFFMYSMVFGSSFLPMVAVIFNSKYIVIDNLYKKLYRMVLLSNLLITFLIYYQNGGLSLALFSSRIDIIGLSSDEHVINSIAIGLYGNTLFILSVYSLMFIEHKNFIQKMFVVFFSLIGLFNVIVSASRGPFLSMFVLLIFVFYFKYRTSSTRIKKIGLIYKVIMALVVGGFLVISAGFLNNSLDKFTLFNRFSDFNNNLESGVKETRNYEYASALNQFYESPIVGDQIVTKYDSFYPHNIYLEVLMSLGVIGGVILLGIHYEIVKRIGYIFKNKNYTFFMILIVLLIILLSSMTSGGIALNPEFWLILALFFSIRYKNMIKSNSKRISLVRDKPTLIEENTVV